MTPMMIVTAVQLWSVAGKPVIISKPESIVCRIAPAISFTMIASCYMYNRAFPESIQQPIFPIT